MSIQLDGIDQWRDYFRTANADIFEIIEWSIMVAASDCPKEFKLRRDRVAELLFSTRLARCTQCDRVGLSVPESDESGGGARVEFEGPRGSKESNANSIRDDQKEIHLNQMSNYSSGDAEALTDEIEEEGLLLQEVLRIKEVLNNFEDESDSVLFELLRKLQLMRLTVSTLKATEIGKSVNGLRRHGAKQIRHLVRELIGEWKAIVDEFIQGGRDPAGHGEATPDSVNPSVVEDEEEEEEGLPSPPMDDCAFFTAGNIDFAQFFDGMDDDGNLRNSGEFNKNQEGGRKPFLVKPEQSPKEEIVLPKEEKFRQPMKQESVPKATNKPLNQASGPGRPIKSNVGQRVNPSQMLQKISDKPNVPRKPAIQSENIRCSTEDTVQDKMEATKRRLQERYQEAKDAKRQRTVQVVEIHDLPKQGLGQRNPKNKVGNPNRKWANARR